MYKIRKFTRAVCFLLVCTVGLTLFTPTYAQGNVSQLPEDVASSVAPDSSASVPQQSESGTSTPGSGASSASQTSAPESSGNSSTSVPTGEAPDSNSQGTASSSVSTSVPATSEPTDGSKPESMPSPEATREPLRVNISGDVQAKAGEKVTLTAALNRTEAIAAYQWQRLYTPESEQDTAAALQGGDLETGEQTYYLPVEGMKEAELLAINPEATWPGKEMWDAAVAAAGGDTSVHLENGTPITVPSDTPAWENMEEATASSLTITAGEDTANTSYRCIVTLAMDVDASEKEAPASDAEKERKNAIPTTLISDEMHIVLKQPQPFALFSSSSEEAPAVKLQDGWLVGVSRDMEYITEDAYKQYNAGAVDNAYWTKLAGGTRADGTTYISQSFSMKDGQYRMPLLSAWYGKTVYVRRVGHAGQGTGVRVDAYTDIDFSTGKKVLYKKVLSVLSVRVPETGLDFYSVYIDGIANTTTRELLNGKGTALVYGTAPLTPNKGQYPVCFNTNPERYLQDAEGNYRFDSVMLGVNVLVEPDLSGKAAWALKDYMDEGYGIMTGHDMMYGYGGVTSPDYVPDANSTTTPYYELNTNSNGHWNMNWLMGANKLYKDASPYEAASMVLCSGSWVDKSTLYGDNYGLSTVRVNDVIAGDADTDTNIRCPTNYPYNYITVKQGQRPVQKGTIFETNSTHSNQQLAYGKVWLDFSSNSLIESGCGQLITDTRKGLTGTNNFYLTTNGNLALNQIGHRVTGQAAGYAELQIFANTILYISQRQQCQVCQSEQGGNKEVHFVHRISSVKQLERLKDQEKYWYTYPTDGCYILTANLVLPSDWSPIEGFYGHFHANGYNVTLGANGAPLFANTEGILGQYTSATNRGWNLGTDKTRGLNAVVNTDGQRATGMARVSGFLGTLFSEDNDRWKQKIVIIEGSDGTTYSCKTNADGKYVLSNLPCTGIMKARVYDTDDIGAVSKANEVTRYGPIRVNVPEAFWATDETTELYLLGFTPIPVENQTVYEEQDALFVEGGVHYTSPVTDVRWQYKTKLSGDWQDITAAPFPYTVRAPQFHEKGEDSYTTSAIEVPACKESMDGFYFQAIFTVSDGRSAATGAASAGAKQGKLTVLPRPAYLTQAQDKSVWIDCDAQFASTIEYWKRPEDGLKMEWEYSTNAGRTWNKSSALERSSVTHTVAENTSAAHKALAPWLVTYTVDLKGCLTSYDRNGGMLLRAVYSYTNEVKTRTWNSGEANKPGYTGKLNVKHPTIEADAPTYQVLNVNQSVSGQYYAAPGAVDTSIYAKDNVAVFESVITYSPGLVDAMNGAVGVPTVQWQYKDNVNGAYRTWTNTDVQKWAARGTGFTAVETVSAPKKSAGDNVYQVTATLTLSNCPVEMDAGAMHHWFRVYASTVFTNDTAYLTTKAEYTSFGYAYDADSNAGKVSSGADLTLLYDIDIKHNEPTITKTKAYSDWVYPQLEVKAQRGARSSIVKFKNSNFDSRDQMYFPSNIGAAIALYPQIKYSGNQYCYVFSSRDGSLLSEDYWQGFLRLIVWRTYDLQANGGTDIMWYIDEQATPDNTFYSSVTGHFYQYVKYASTWENCRANASKLYFAENQGYLASVTSQAEQTAIIQLVGGPNAWIGGRRNGNTWIWDGGPACPESGQAIKWSCWAIDQPDNQNGLEDKLQQNCAGGGKWNDVPNDNSAPTHARTEGYIAEFGGVSDVLKRTNHSALDTDNIYVLTTGNFAVTVTANSKVYDGLEQNATVTIRNISGLNAEDLNSIAAYGMVTYSNGEKTDVLNNAAKPGSNCVHTGEYTAIVTFPGLPIEYSLSSLDSTTRAEFEITSRPVYAEGTAVRAYDGTDVASVSGISVQPTGAETGIIAADAARVKLNKTTCTGVYTHGIHQTNGVDVVVNVALDDDVSLTGDTFGDYSLFTSYTGRITPRPLHVHSRYLEEPDKPRNIRAYDGTIGATVRNILIDGVVQGDDVTLDKQQFAGTYDSAKAQETLTPDGKVQAQRFLKLGESEIMRTEDIALVNNDYGDYAIGSESYSGAVFRKTLEASIPGYTSVYGEAPVYKFEALPEYSKDSMGGKDTLKLAQLAAGDILTIDNTKSDFVYPAVGAPDETSDAGMYEVTYEGLTQDNYPVLENYIVTVMPGGVIITPRTLIITMDGGYHKEQGKGNPQFGVTYSGFVNDDTPETALQGKLTFETSCEKDSPPLFMPDKETLRGYAVFAEGLLCRENEKGFQNYEIEWMPGDLKVYSLGLVVEKSADKEVANVGETIHYTLTIKNISSIALKNVKVQDTNSGAGEIEAVSTDAYRYLGNGSFLLPELPYKGAVTIRYTYTARHGDANTMVRNRAVASIPGNPFDPENPFDPDAPADPGHVYPSEEVKVWVPQLIGSIALRHPPSSIVVRDTDSGALLSYTLKPFPKTGVSVTDGTLTKEERFSLPIGQAPAYSMPDRIEHEGTRWLLDTQHIVRADGLRGDENETVQLEGLEKPEVAQTYVVQNGARSYTLFLEKVTYTQTKAKKVDIEYKNLQKKPQAPNTYLQEKEGVQTQFKLESVEQLAAPRWRKVEIPAVYYGDAGYRFYAGTAEIPYDAQKPVFAGYEQKLLALLKTTPAQYRLKDSYWTDAAFSTDASGVRYRRGVYVAEIYTGDWVAHYTTGEDTTNATATYTANGSKKKVEYCAVGTYTQPVKPWLHTWVGILVTTLLGVLLVVVLVVLVLLVLAKKRKQEKKE